MRLKQIVVGIGIIFLLSLFPARSIEEVAIETAVIEVAVIEDAAIEKSIKKPKQRIISTSNVITQAVVALGEEEQLVGVDTTSRLSKSLKKLPDIGYRLALSTEGILSLNPSLLLLYDGSGPKNVLEQLERSNVAQMHIPINENLEDIEVLAIRLGVALGNPQSGKQLANKIGNDAHRLEELLHDRTSLNALFIMEEMEGKGSLSIAGRDTNAEKMMTLLKINNLFSSHFSNYKSVSLESQLMTKPDLVLIGSRRDFDVEGKPLFSLHPHGVSGWPKQLQPKCVFDISISDYLVYGIHIYEIGYQLREAIDQCMQMPLNRDAADPDAIDTAHTLINKEQVQL